MRKRTKPSRRGVLPRISNRLLTTLVVLAAAGFAASVYLTYVSDRLRADANFQSLCAINDLFDCDRVVSSLYGSLGGIPLAWFAAWFYALFALVAFGTRGPVRTTRLRSPALLFVLASAFAVLLSVTLAAVSLLILHAVCLLCATLYAVNLGLFLTSWMALRSSGETFVDALSAERRHRRLGQLLISASLVPVVLFLAPVMSHRLVWGRSRFCELVGDAHPAAGQPLRLTIYSDVQCPHCQALDHLLRPLRSAPGLQIITRQYPLDAECNPRVQRGGHPGACLQARALLCARAQERYNELSDRLYDEGPADQGGLVRLAASVGLDERRFVACLGSSASADELGRDMAAGRAAGVHGTPTILFDTGERFSSPLTAEEVTCLAAAAARVSVAAPNS